MWGCFLMSGVKILHFLKDWWKSIPIHQNYTMALTGVKMLATLRILNNSGLFCVPVASLYDYKWFYCLKKGDDVESVASLRRYNAHL